MLPLLSVKKINEGCQELQEEHKSNKTQNKKHNNQFLNEENDKVCGHDK
jgi:hypothetical protein